MKNNNVLNSFQVIVLFAALLAGCGQNINGPSVPPLIKAEINAELTGNAISYLYRDNFCPCICNTVVSARVESVEEYAQQKRRGWSSKCYWYTCKTKRISTIQGDFNDEEVNFVFSHQRSGKRKTWLLTYFVDTKPIPFNKDMIISICLKNGKGLHQIIAFQKSS